MNYIKKVNIKNFQSHTSSELTFENGMNVIIGPSDQGKTSIIRAIKWVLFNEPKGTEFIRTGATWASVSIELSNGFTITRERSKTKNRYILTHPDGEVDIYEGFGNEVPYEVIKTHGVFPTEVDKETGAKLSISEQLEGPFLLTQSASARAKVIGRLSGIHILDKAIKDCLIDIRRESQAHDRLKQDINNIDKELEQYKDLENLGETILIANKLIKQLEGLTARKGRLKELKDKLAVILDSLKEEMLIIRKTKDVAKALELMSQLGLRYDNYALLKRLKISFNRISEAETEQMELLMHNVKNSHVLTEKYIQALSLVSRCPLCGNVICEDTIEKIVQELLV